MPAKVAFLLAGIALLAAVVVATTVFIGGDRRLLLTGRTTDAHHQLETSCETCHGEAAFADAAAAREALNRSCRNCHEDALDAAADSHPRSKFRNPRMAAYREKLDARLCTSCHVEHRPEITRAGGVTVAMDFCVACHSEGEQDVRSNRPSHAGLAFDTCASAGCHNFHDNRALYEDFLVERADGPWLASAPVHALSALAGRLPQPADAALSRGDAVAPDPALVNPAHLDRWAASGHATAGVNCADCHAATVGEAASPAAIETHWDDAPLPTVCADCHRRQARSFVLGRHGMRGHPGIAKPRDPRPALERVGLGDLPEGVVNWLSDPSQPESVTVAEARLPMRAEAARRSPNCTACHGPHAVDTRRAAVEACAECHDDAHTRAYFGSPHHERWQAELAGTAPAGAGVSCATCHMAKSERRGVVTTNHNQNDNLRPNEKMIRPVCLDCHGLRFSLDALADPALIERNFRGPPEAQVRSIDWAARRPIDPSRGG